MRRRVRLWAYYVALYWSLWWYSRLQKAQLKLLSRASECAQRVTFCKVRCIEEELKQG